ncbi:molybdopterin-dependent oxidoreductase [bacterium]|nr:molybdopterin-dependent oxidoreductase [bacterium]
MKSARNSKEIKKVKLLIDMKEVEANPGSTILQTADNEGIFIPRMCYFPTLEMPGSCRICQVEVKGVNKLELACRTVIKEGMEVYTDNERVKAAQKSVLELLLIDHPLDCPICDQAGECILHDYYMKIGLYQSRFIEPKKHKPKVQDYGRYIVYDAERCILCTRCVRFLKEVTGTCELDLFERGNKTFISIFPGKKIDNPYSLNVAEICPVGALTNKDFRFRCRVWFLNSTLSVCPGCARGCNIYIDHHKNQVFRYRTRKNTKVNYYWLCDEGRMTYKILRVENRCTSAMMKIDGVLKKVPLQKAYEAIIEKFKTLDKKDKKKIFGIASPFASNEDNYLFVKIMRDIVGTENIDYRVNDYTGYSDEILICKDHTPNSSGAADMGALPGKDGLSFKEIVSTDSESRIKILFLMDHDLLKIMGKEQFEEFIKRVDTLILQSSYPNSTIEYADIFLPAALWAECSGTFSNGFRRIQKFEKAIEPPEDARAHWEHFVELSRPLGKTLRYKTSDEITKEIGKNIKGYIKLSEEPLSGRGVIVRK